MTYLINKITNFFQEPNKTFNEAWERFKGLLRQCPHHGFTELHQLDTFYNSLNSNDQDALDSAAGGNFLDKMPQEGLAIIETIKSFLFLPPPPPRYSRSRANDSRVSTDAPLSTSSPSNNSFDMQQIAASLEDKMTIKMKQMMNEMKALVVTTPAPIKAVEEVCVTCGSNHNFNHCPLTRGGNDFPVFHDNIQQFQQTAAVGETSIFSQLVRFVWKMMTRIAIRKKIICLLATYLHKTPKPLSRPQAVEEMKIEKDKVSSDVPIHTIVMPIRITFDNPIDFNDHFSKPKDFKKDLTVKLDSRLIKFLPSPLLEIRLEGYRLSLRSCRQVLP
ncbi:reverse transcriptase domain-containing protein [Tanacetum coccineum]